jgi:hypothetical protein
MKTSNITACTGRVLCVALTLTLLGCSSGVDVTFHLINPCTTDVLNDNAQCQHIQVKVSSLDPQDPLHCRNNPPASKTCSLGEGKCTLNDEDLIGLARVVDVLCYTDRAGSPVARATSTAFTLDDTAGGMSFNLLLGNIDGFVETTILESENLSACSFMAEINGRYGHASVLMEDGRVLITGGIQHLGTAEDILATAEIFDPDTGLHQMVTGGDGMPLKMLALSGRAYHTATLLRDGRILLAGGIGLVEGKKTSLQSAEIFDPGPPMIFPPNGTSVMGSGRAHHTATTLATGEVLIAGGASYSNGVLSNYFDTAVLYNPATNAFTPVSNTMGSPRAFHQSVLLDPVSAGGKVLVIGGEDPEGTLNSFDIYSPETLKFLTGVVATMKKNRSHHCAVLLNNGEVLVAGGKTTVDDTSVDSVVEIYSTAEGPYGGFKEQTFSLNVSRMDHTCTKLQSGNILVAGGLTQTGQATGAGEMIIVGETGFQPRQLTDVIAPPRFLHTATMLRSGWVLLAGGLPSQAPDVQAVTQSCLFVPEPACE